MFLCGKKAKDRHGGKKSGNGDGGSGAPTLVFKVDLHCYGCARKVKSDLKKLTGVESVKTDVVTNKVTVVGNVEPATVQCRVEAKIKRTVEFMSSSSQSEIDAS